MKKILFAAVLLQLIGCTDKNDGVTKSFQTSADSFSTAGKKVFAFTTADSTNLRLSATDTTTFADFGQPFETQVCVFVDPTKTDQTYMGIGAAITDASAETLAKLPADKQAEVLKAYFDKEKGALGLLSLKERLGQRSHTFDKYSIQFLLRENISVGKSFLTNSSFYFSNQ